MNTAVHSESHRAWVWAAFLGVWAAAIAAVPGLAAKAVLAAPAVLVPFAWWTLRRPARWLAAFLGAALLLPPLPIAIGNSGPHPSLLLAAWGVFCGLIWLAEWRFAWSGVTAALLALTAVLTASVAVAAMYSGAEIAAGSLARVALFAIPVYVFLYTAHGPSAAFDSFRATRWLYGAATVSALFACVDFYYQFPAPAGYGPQFVWLDSGVYRRAQGLFYEAGTLGNFCAFFLVMIAVGLSRSRAEAPLSRKAMAAGGAVFFAALVLSYSRGSLVNVLVALAVLAWLNRRRLRLLRRAPALAAGAAAAALLTWKIFPAFIQVYWLRLEASAQYLFSSTEGVLSGRVASWRVLADWIAAHPWQLLFGVGYKTLPYSDYLGTTVVADNMYLSLLVETGIGGLAALVWLHVAILRAARRAARAPDARRSFFGTWMLCFWSGQVVQMASSDLLTYWRVLPVYFWVLALAARA
ncbi:MAG TPA: O-antigen ligase family protein [Bryobacteraceae bacterium]